MEGCSTTPADASLAPEFRGREIPRPPQRARDDASSPDASLFPEFHDGGVVEIFLGGAFDGAVGFAGGGGGGQRDSNLIGEVERETEIFVHEAQRETWRV